MYLPKVLGALALVSSVVAQSVTFCPDEASGVCYAFDVPEVSASGGTGDIYFQISGPTTISWIGLGQGTQMKGANIFVVYANAAGTNVTLSPRLGLGHMMPKSNTTAEVTLLGGSGISDGVMTANVRCSNCNSWDGGAGTMMFNDKNSDWIFVYKTGPAIKSDNVSAPIMFHDKYGPTSIDLTKAVGGDSLNQFPTSGSTSGSGTTGGAFGDTKSGTKPPLIFTKVLMAHAILLPLAFVVFYPLGAMAVRLARFNGLVFLHAGWMIFTYLIVLGGMGLGVWMALIFEELTTYHAIIGLVVTGALLLQPLTGLLHHLLFKRYNQKNGATHSHVWWGRAVITLGIINGGFGLQLADNSKSGNIIYGVLAGFFWVLWMGVILFSAVRSRGGSRKEMGNKNSEQVSRNGEKDHSTERIREEESARQNSTTDSVRRAMRDLRTLLRKLFDG